MSPNESQPNPTPGNSGNPGRPPFKKRNAPPTPPPAGAPAQPGAFKPRPQAGTGPARPAFVPTSQRPAVPPPPPRPAKKKRRVRTKQCAKCMMPCILLTRAKLDKSIVWHLVCDFCWPTFCDGNPDYHYGGTWINGRIVDPVQPQGGPSSPKLAPHHIHGPQIVRGRTEEMDDEDDDFDDGHDAPPARAPAPRPEAQRPALTRPAAPAPAPRPPAPALPAQLMADIEALEVEDGGEEDDDTPETGAAPQDPGSQNGDGGRKKRRRRRKRKGGGGNPPPQAGNGAQNGL